MATTVIHTVRTRSNLDARMPAGVGVSGPVVALALTADSRFQSDTFVDGRTARLVKAP
jgi:hypothetical protein